MSAVAIITAGPDAGLVEHIRASVMVEDAGHEPVYFGINDLGTYHPDPLHHWVSAHPKYFRDDKHRWEDRRKDAGLACEYQKWSRTRRAGVRGIAERWWKGSSGLLAVAVALECLDCAGVVLCGVRMDDAPNPLNPDSLHGWEQADRFWARWEARMTEIEGRVKSMSGRTADVLGRPDAAWLSGL